MSNASLGLSILGGSVGGGGTSVLPASVLLRNYQKDPVEARSNFLNREDIQRKIDSFNRNAEKIESVDDLLDDRRTFEFVLTAFGLQNELNNPGKMRVVLESDPDDINSFANRLNDPRFGEIAAFFNFANLGPTNIRQTDKQAEVINKFLENQFEVDAGNQNPAFRDALFFLRSINDVQNTFDILGNLPLRGIVTQALGLPQQIALQSVDKQASLIERRFDVSKAALSASTDENAPLSRAELLEADLARLGTANEQVTAAIEVIEAIEQRLTDLDTDLNDIGNVTDPAGVKAAEIAVQSAVLPDLLRQRALLTAADEALTSTDTVIERLDAIFDEAKAVTTDEELTNLKTEFADLVSQVTGSTGFINSASLTDPQSGQTENLLRSTGDAGEGIDALATDPLETTINVEGTKVIIRGSDLTNFLTTLDSANTSFQSITFGNVLNDITAAETSFESAQTDFDDADFNNFANNASFNGSVNSVEFAMSLDTQNLALGISAVDDAIERAGTATTLLDQITTLAAEASEEGADITDLNTQYQAALSSLQDAINTAGSVSDGTTTVNFQNLLTSGDADFSVDGTNNIRARGGNLDTSVLTSLPTDLTVANASTIRSDISTTLKPAVETVNDRLVQDRQLFDFAANRADAQGALDANVRAIATGLDADIASAEVADRNLLDEFSNDVTLRLDSLGLNLTISAETTFESTLRGILDTYQTLTLTGGTVADRQAAVQDALIQLSSFGGRLRGEQLALDIQQSILESSQAPTSTEVGSAFLTPPENTAYAVKFIEQYLIRQEAQAAGAQFGAVNNNAALVGLFQGLGGGNGLNLNLTL